MLSQLALPLVGSLPELGGEIGGGYDESLARGDVLGIKTFYHMGAGGRTYLSMHLTFVRKSKFPLAREESSDLAG
jgi:hypothetical protein